MQTTLPQPPNPPPPLPEALTPQKFRQIIAGLVDPDANPMNPGCSDEYKIAAQGLYLHLATHFNRKRLNPLTLWTRISDGVKVACASVPDGDFGKFMGICLTQILARESVFAADDEAANFMVEHDEKSPAWRQGFIRWLGTHGQIAVVHGPTALAGRAERIAGGESGKKIITGMSSTAFKRKGKRECN